MTKIGLTILFAVITCRVYSQRDTLHIYVRGYYDKNQKFMIKYNSTPVKEFGYDKTQVSVKLPIDATELKEFEGLNMQILEWNKRKKEWNHLKYKFIYYPNYKHILIYYMPFSSTKKSFQVFYLPYYIELFVFD